MPALQSSEEEIGRGEGGQEQNRAKRMKSGEMKKIRKMIRKTLWRIPEGRVKNAMPARYQ